MSDQIAMNPELKLKWTKALRSGVYQQGVNALLNNGKYCCLGVLCDVIEPNGWLKETNLNQDVMWKGLDQEEPIASSLPLKLLDFVGIPVAAEQALMVMNDDEEKSFEEIAKYIDLNL